MKTTGPLRWILPLLRYGLCVVAVFYLASVVRWSDRVRLTETGEQWHKLVQSLPDGLVIERDGRRETVPHTAVRRVTVANQQIEEIDLGIPTVLRQANKWQALLAILLFLPVSLIQSLRLNVMLLIQGVWLSIWTGIKLTFAGNFFNFALPGTTGGDLIKAYYITRYTPLKTEAVTTVFLDRAIGLFVLVVLAGGAILFTRDPSQFGKIIMSLSILCAVLAAGAIVVFSKRIRDALRLRDFVLKLPFGEHVIRVGRATVAMRQRKSLVLLAFAMTLVLQAIVMISAGVMAWALGIQGHMSDFFIYCSIGFLIAAIPISPPQAIGVMEAAYVQFFLIVDPSNDPSRAVALALAVRLIQLVWALPGVLVPLLGAHLPSQTELSALENEGETSVSEAAAATVPASP